MSPAAFSALLHFAAITVQPDLGEGLARIRGRLQQATSGAGAPEATKPTEQKGQHCHVHH